MARFRLSFRSKRNLKGVHPHLVQIVELAGELLRKKHPHLDFVVICGLRSKKEQIENVRKGVSWTLRSRHLTGHAVDLAALVDGKVSWAWPPYHEIAAAMFAAARKLGYTLEWGGHWSAKYKDGPHFQLPRKDYPA